MALVYQVKPESRIVETILVNVRRDILEKAVKKVQILELNSNQNIQVTLNLKLTLTLI